MTSRVSSTVACHNKDSLHSLEIVRDVSAIDLYLRSAKNIP